MNARLRPPTPGTRIAVWIFPVLTVWLGLTYLFGPSQRLQSPAFEAAKQVMPMHWWGIVFLTVAAVKVACILLGSDRGYVVAMCAGMGLYAWWAFLFGAAVFADNQTSLAAPAWPAAIAVLHAATLATLTNRKLAPGVSG